MKSLRGPLVLLAALGLIVAIVLLLIADLSQGTLRVFGLELSPDYSVAQLTASIISLFQPALLIIPIAFAQYSIKRPARDWTLIGLAPAALIGPCIPAAWICGGDPSLTPLIALVLLGLLNINLTLWIRLGLKILPSTGMCYLIWGILWALSGFGTYVVEYVLPSLEFGFAPAIAFLLWILPPMDLGFLDLMLQTDQFPWRACSMIAVQIAALAVIQAVLASIKRR